MPVSFSEFFEKKLQSFKKLIKKLIAWLFSVMQSENNNNKKTAIVLSILTISKDKWYLILKRETV